MAYWLLVEDEIDIRNVVKVMFQVWGHTAIEFSNGNDSFDYLDDVESGEIDASELPELALMDIRMPGPNGNEIAHRIRECEPIKSIPIILMTAFQLSEAQQKGFREQDGVDEIIFKPLPDFDRFRKIIHDVIDKKKAANSGTPASTDTAAGTAKTSSSMTAAGAAKTSSSTTAAGAAKTSSSTPSGAVKPSGSTLSGTAKPPGSITSTGSTSGTPKPLIPPKPTDSKPGLS